MALEAVVVVPAHDEQQRIAGCLEALAAQTLATDRFATIVVLDRCRDQTAAVVECAAAELGLAVSTHEGTGSGPGAARRLGMDAACQRLLAEGSPRGLIACTDADSRPAADWLERQIGHVAAGARAIAGLIELDPIEAGQLPPGVLERRALDGAERLRRVRAADPAAAHHHSAGASLAVTAETYRQVGGIEPLPALEDAGFAERLARHQIALLRPADVRVITSARADGRVARGLSVDFALSSWAARRRYRAGDFSADGLRACKAATTVSVIVPAKDCAETVGGVVRETIEPLRRAGLIDDVVVIDAASADGTAEVAARAGARVLQQDRLSAELGPVMGKGDAMWRALRATDGDVVCFLDADTADPHHAHLLGLLGPILSDRSVALVKGAFERPLSVGAVKLPNEGGRVTELMARPLLNLHEPLLAGFSQPLAGEIAARRDLLVELPFPVGYGVEIAMLVDALHLRGLDALAECHLGTRQNRHQPLRALGEMAFAVLTAIEHRLPVRSAAGASSNGLYMRPWEDCIQVPIPVIERAPIREAPA